MDRREALGSGIDAGLEDERGRYSPARESGVHRFHELMVDALRQA